MILARDRFEEYRRFFICVVWWSRWKHCDWSAQCAEFVIEVIGSCQSAYIVSGAIGLRVSKGLSSWFKVVGSIFLFGGRSVQGFL